MRWLKNVADHVPELSWLGGWRNPGGRGPSLTGGTDRPGPGVYGLTMTRVLRLRAGA
jgi:hypothetical protein